MLINCSLEGELQKTTTHEQRPPDSGHDLWIAQLCIMESVLIFYIFDALYSLKSKASPPPRELLLADRRRKKDSQ